MSDPKAMGSLQARLSKEDPRFYNPNRDVAHNFREVIQIVAARLEDNAWPELGEILAREKVTMDELGDACAALCKFVATSVDNPKEGMKEGMDRCGWEEVPPGAQVAVMAILGTVTIGYHWAGVREATIGGEGPAMTLKELATQGEISSRYITMPRWKRALDRLYRRTVNALGALKGD